MVGRGRVIKSRDIETALAPFNENALPAVKAGENRLEVRVANLWVNRLIGDAQPGAEKIGFTVFNAYRPDALLRPAGLIGPVRLLTSGNSGQWLGRRRPSTRLEHRAKKGESVFRNKCSGSKNLEQASDPISGCLL